MASSIKKFLMAALCVALAFPVALAQNHQKEWHEAKTINGNFKAISSQPDIDVFSSPNIIMIKVNRETEVRLFTILGKLIIAQKLSPGIFEYHIDTHGIFIIKTDDSSCKIAV